MGSDVVIGSSFIATFLALLKCALDSIALTLIRKTQKSSEGLITQVGLASLITAIMAVVCMILVNDSFNFEINIALMK